MPLTLLQNVTHTVVLKLISLQAYMRLTLTQNVNIIHIGLTVSNMSKDAKVHPLPTVFKQVFLLDVWLELPGCTHL